MAQVEVAEQEGQVSTGGNNFKHAQRAKQKSLQSELALAPAAAYFPIGNAFGLTEESNIPGSRSIIQCFNRYVVNCGVLLLDIDNADLLEGFLAVAASRSAVKKFVMGDDASFVLEMQSTLKAPGVDDDGDLEAMFRASDVTFGVYDEIPSSVFHTVSSEFQVSYLVFTKIEVGGLRDPENTTMASQLIINKFNAAQPFQAMIPTIRHTYVPLATLRTQKEEKEEKEQSLRSRRAIRNRFGDPSELSDAEAILEKLRELELKLMESQDEAKFADVSLEPITEIKQWLDGLGTAEKKVIIRAHQTQKYDVEIPEYLQNDQLVIGKLLKRLHAWKEDIESVARRTRSSSGRLNTVQQEITFWKAKMAALEHVEAELNSVGVCASTLVLIQNNKRVVVGAFLEAVQVKQAKDEVQQHNDVLSSFPMKALMTSSSVQDMIKVIADIFQHLDAFKLKKLKHNYPVERIAILARAAARDVSNQLREVLSRKVMTMKYSLFVQRTRNTERLFHNFQNKYTKLRSNLRQRELLENKERSFSGTWHRDQETELNALQKRVESIKKIRKGHAEMEKVIQSAIVHNAEKRILQDALNKITDAFKVFRKLDVLKASAFEWDQCVEEYESKIQEVENEIQSMIRRAMENASDSQEMFRICEKYRGLLVRDRIRNAIWEFQGELINTVQNETRQLQKRYRQNYSEIPASRLCQLRDIPLVSGQVIWLRQLKRQLDQNEERLEAVLGADWKSRLNAKDLAEQMSTFAKHLDPILLVRQWETEAKSRPNFDDQAPIFKIDSGVNKSLSLNVAFDENYVKLFKEVRCLLSLGIRIDISLRLSCIDVKAKYPIAVKLKEAVSMFSRACSDIDQYTSEASNPVFEELGSTDDEKQESGEELCRPMMSQLATLVDDFKYECQRTILQGAQHRWQNHEKQLNQYVATLSKSTISLQEKTQRAYDVSHECDKILQELLICPLTRECITEKIDYIQSTVNKLDDGDFYGVPYWTQILNQKLERIFIRRVDEILDRWIHTLDEDWDTIENNVNDNGNDDELNIFRRREPVTHTIRLDNNSLLVQPALSEAKLILGRDIQSLLSMLVDLPRPKSDLARFARRRQGHGLDDPTQNTFRSILQHISTRKIIACYRKIEEITSAATEYTNAWLSYQALYDIDLDTVFEALDDDIGKWKQLLMEMKAMAEALFDTAAEKCFGPIVISYGVVRSKIDTKQRALRRQTFKALKNRLGKLLRDFHVRAMRGKQELEDLSFDIATTKKFIASLTQLLTLKSESAGWMELWSEYEEAERLLVSNRYTLGSAWMYASRVKSVLNDFFQVLSMRWNEVKEEASMIGSKLEERNDNISDAVIKLEKKWHAEKPIDIWASAWTDKEVVDWMRNYRDGVLRPYIEGFRASSVDGRTLHVLSEMDGPRLAQWLETKMDIAPENQTILISAMDSLLFTQYDVHSRLLWFEQQIKSIKESSSEIKMAKRAMTIIVNGDDSPTGQNEMDMMVNSIKGEVTGLKEIHKVLTAEWEKLEKLGKENFMKLDSGELFKILHRMEKQLSKLSHKMQKYQVYQQFSSMIALRKRMCNTVLGELNAGGIESPILQEKHWKEIFQLLDIKRDGSMSLVLEDLWSVNLLKHLNEIRAICHRAQSENSSAKRIQSMIMTPKEPNGTREERNLSLEEEFEDQSSTETEEKSLNKQEYLLSAKASDIEIGNSLERDLQSATMTAITDEIESEEHSSEEQHPLGITTKTSDDEIEDDALSRVSPIYKRPRHSVVASKLSISVHVE